MLHWIFQDVHPGGAAAIAGIEPRDILLNVDGKILPRRRIRSSLWENRLVWRSLAKAI
jgi:S1-C subfamily serine protease